MKKVLKYNFIVLLIFTLTVFVLAPSIFAAEYKNICSEDEADIVFNIQSDKTKLQPGDTFTLTYTVDKMPANGLGLSACNFRLIYDSTQLTFVASDLGQVSERFSMTTGPDRTEYPREFENAYQAVYGAAGGEGDVTDTGIIATITFKVNREFTGKPTLYITDDNGFSGSGVKLDEQNRPIVDSDVKCYLKTNMNEITITTNEISKGDINQDGMVNINDIIYGGKGFTNGTLTAGEKEIGNVNEDSVFNINDLIKIMKFIVGKISVL